MTVYNRSLALFAERSFLLAPSAQLSTSRNVPMSPKSEGVPLSTGDNSINVRGLLSAYINFLAISAKLNDATSLYESESDCSNDDMAAIFDRSNPASPLAYGASKTALLLLDLQGFCIDRCGLAGLAALGKAKTMRDWAFCHQIPVIHSVVDVEGRPPPTCKGAERIEKMLDGISGDRDATEEPTEISFGKKDGEYIVLKHPGFASALKSNGMMELLDEHGIRSLILCGVGTSGAVLRTAMPASDEGFIVSVIQDACADATEALHETLIKSVLPSRAHVATAEEFMKEWAKAQH